LLSSSLSLLTTTRSLLGISFLFSSAKRRSSGGEYVRAVDDDDDDDDGYNGNNEEEGGITNATIGVIVTRLMTTPCMKRKRRILVALRFTSHE
jgi:hypothetical protein